MNSLAIENACAVADRESGSSSSSRAIPRNPYKLTTSGQVTVPNKKTTAPTSDRAKKTTRYVVTVSGTKVIRQTRD